MIDEIQKKRAEYFKGKNAEVHIQKKDGFFCNGFIIRIEDHYFEVNDRMDGIVPIFYDELYPDSITEFKEKKE